MHGTVIQGVALLVLAALAGSTGAAADLSCNRAPEPGEPGYMACLKAKAAATFNDIVTKFFLPHLNKEKPDCSLGGSGGDACNYWHLGNTFDTTLDYLATQPPQVDVGRYGAAVLATYQDTDSPQENLVAGPCWYDDYGWWAVATQRAAALQGFWPPEQEEGFRKTSDAVWALMQPASRVWALCTNTINSPYDPGEPRDCEFAFSSLQPFLDGGVWNFFWSNKTNAKTNACPDHNNSPDGDQCDPIMHKDTNGLCGRQNSVTNGLYYVASSRRFAASRAPLDGWRATREHRFLTSWLDAAETGLLPNYSLLMSRLPWLHGELVRERVSTYSNYGQDWGFRTDLAWAGDQGLMLGGLISYLKANPPSSPDEAQRLHDLASAITDGVQSYLTNSDGLFLSWHDRATVNADQWKEEFPGMGIAPGKDAGSYNTGIGVYLRYLLFAYQNDAILAEHIRKSGIRDFVLRFAQKVMDDPTKVCGGLGGSCAMLDQDTNVLATLTAAIAMASDPH